MCPLDVIKTRLQVHGLPQVSQSARQGLCSSLSLILEMIRTATLSRIASFRLNKCKNDILRLM